MEYIYSLVYFFTNWIDEKLGKSIKCNLCTVWLQHSVWQYVSVFIPGWILQMYKLTSLYPQKMAVQVVYPLPFLVPFARVVKNLCWNKHFLSYPPSPPPKSSALQNKIFWLYHSYWNFGSWPKQNIFLKPILDKVK